MNENHNFFECEGIRKMERLKQIRKSKKITQKQMAALIFVSERTYQNYELGVTEPSLSTLLKMAEVLTTSVDYLLGRDDDTHLSNHDKDVLEQAFLILKKQ